MMPEVGNAKAVVVRFMPLAKASARCWTMFQQHYWSCAFAAPNMLAAPVEPSPKRLHLNDLLLRDWQRQRFSRKCWSPNIVTTRRFIDNPKSLPAMVLS